MNRWVQKHKILTACTLCASLFQMKISSAPLDNKPHAWTSAAFSKEDLPCVRSEVERTFNLLSRRTPDNAYMLMSASFLAYSFWPGKREKISSRWGFKEIHIFNIPETSTNGFWAEHEEFILLAIRGTQEPLDLLTDVDVQLEQADNSSGSQGRVHRGFNSAAHTLFPHAQKAALTAKAKNKALIVTGHSLGGAIALLTALRLEKLNFPVHSIWSFGAPQVGDERFVENAKNQLQSRLQIVNQENDPIPALPFTASDEQLTQNLARRFGSIIPLFSKFALNSAYATSEFEQGSELSSAKQINRPISQRSIKEIARGFLKHIPRAYLCDLSHELLKL
ncbi:lipase family protein [bacterium]|nr:lipase family protein [bacterium]